MSPRHILQLNVQVKSSNVKLCNVVVDLSSGQHVMQVQVLVSV